MNKNRLLLLVISGLLLAAVTTIFYPEKVISPGALITSHSELEADCFACHAPFTGSSATRCIDCHKVDEIGIRTTTGDAIEKSNQQIAFHQQLIETDCAACHSDHQGVLPFRSDNHFSHQLLQEALQEECGDCHDRPKDRIHRNIQKQCNQCHSVDSWDSSTFDHTEYFRFDRYHDADCESCHTDGDYAQYNCYGCHEHSPRNVRGEHLEEGIYEYEVCVECHRSGDEHEAERIWRQKIYQQRGSTKRYPRYRDHDDDH